MKNCPVCGTQLADEGVVCQRCNYRCEDNAADIRSSAQYTEQRRAAAKPRSPFQTGPPERIEGDAPSQADIHTRIVELESERDRKTRIVELEVPAVVRRAMRQREREKDESGGKKSLDLEWSLLDQLQEQLEVFYVRLHPLDRWTWWTLIGVALAVFLPWRAAGGVQLEAGIEGVGLGTLFAAVTALVCIHARTIRRRLARKLMLLQFAATALVFAAPVRIALSTDPKHLKFGVMITTFLGLLAAGLGLVRLVRLKDAAAE